MGTCFITSGSHFSDFNQARCTKADPTRHNYLLIGDSHAAALWYGLDQELTKSHILMATDSGCHPSLGDYDSTDCGRMRRYIYENLLPTLRVDGVILTAHWQTEAEVDSIEPAILWLREHDIPVIIVGPVQEYDAPLPMLLAFSIKWQDASLAERHLLPNIDRLDRLMQAKAEEWHVAYLSPWRASCGTGRCLDYADNGGEIPMLSDTNHLTNAGAVRLVKGWVSDGIFH